MSSIDSKKRRRFAAGCALPATSIQAPSPSEPRGAYISGARIVGSTGPVAESARARARRPRRWRDRPRNGRRRRRRGGRGAARTRRRRGRTPASGCARPCRSGRGRAGRCATIAPSTQVRDDLVPAARVEAGRVHQQDRIAAEPAAPLEVRQGDAVHGDGGFDGSAHGARPWEKPGVHASGATAAACRCAGRPRQRAASFRYMSAAVRTCRRASRTRAPASPTTTASSGTASRRGSCSIQRCAGCRRLQHPPAPMCPALSRLRRWRRSRRRGAASSTASWSCTIRPCRRSSIRT